MQNYKPAHKLSGTPYSLALAMQIRLAAEKSNSPEKYFQAAAEFQALGMPVASLACIARAIFYQKKGEETL